MEIALIIYILSIVLALMVWSILIHVDYQHYRRYTEKMFLGVLSLCFIPVINVISAIWGIRELRKDD